MTSARRGRGRRDNGLDAALWSPLTDVDPRVGEHLLDLLAAAGIAAYLEPATDVAPYTRTVYLPSPPSDRLFVDRNRTGEAREVLETGAAKGEVASWLPLGNLYADEVGDLDAAEAAYRSGIAAGDDHSHHDLAGLLEERGDLDGAGFHYRLGAAGGDALAAAALRRLLGED